MLYIKEIVVPLDFFVISKEIDKEITSIRKIMRTYLHKRDIFSWSL